MFVCQEFFEIFSKIIEGAVKTPPQLYNELNIYKTFLKTNFLLLGTIFFIFLYKFFMVLTFFLKTINQNNKVGFCRKI